MNKITQNTNYLLNKEVHLTDDDIILPKGKVVKINHIDSDGFLTIQTIFKGQKIIFNSLKDFFLSEVPENYIEPVFYGISPEETAQLDKGYYVENKKEICAENDNEVYFPGQRFIVINNNDRKLSLLTKDTFGNYINVETTNIDNFIIAPSQKENILTKWISECNILKERDILHNVLYSISFKNGDNEIIVKAKIPSTNTLLIGDEKSIELLYIDLLSVIKNTSLPVRSEEEKNYLLRTFAEYIHSKQDCFCSFKKFVDFKSKQVYNLEHSQIQKRMLI